jgi:hypothetical protein
MCERELYVGRLPLGVRPCELEAVFCEYGELIRCTVKQGERLLVTFNFPVISCNLPSFFYIAGNGMGKYALPF